MSRVLIVEDESIVAVDLQNVLEGLGYTVVGNAVSADDAVSKARDLNPDVILMDIMLRGNKDGITAALEIQKQHNIPIIYLTAYSDPELINNAIKTEPYAYLVKPFQTRQLFAAIEMTLYRSQLNDQLHRTEKWLLTMLKNISDAAIAVDSSGKVSYMNSGAEELTGWGYRTAKDAMVEQVLDLIDASTMERIDVFSYVTGETEPPDRMMLITRSGERIAIECSSSPVKSDTGELIGVVLMFKRVNKVLAEPNV